MRSGLLIGLVSIGLATAKADEPPPSADFLAFLGEMERIDGEWVDPMSVETMPLSGQENSEPGESAALATGADASEEASKEASKEGADNE